MVEQLSPQGWPQLSGVFLEVLDEWCSKNWSYDNPLALHLTNLQIHVSTRKKDYTSLRWFIHVKGHTHCSQLDQVKNAAITHMKCSLFPACYRGHLGGVSSIGSFVAIAAHAIGFGAAGPTLCKIEAKGCEQ